MATYTPTIGIEIHCELKTNTKMFSGAPVRFGKTANTCTSAVDLALPGTLPCVNKEAVRLAIKACTGLNCTIDPLVKFDRKNYYYSDLPKGFQITQQFHPIGKDGYVTIETEEGPKQIRIERIHMEEDTAKQFHKDTGTYIDFNRAGTPLIEIVSRPDMHTAKEAAAYVEALRRILFYLNVSDVKMEEGSMRCDVNISLSDDPKKLGTKVEIKNLNSIANVQKAVAAEIERQSKALDEGEPIIQSTRRYDESQKGTVLMRKKEGAVDYKYFPEPNIFPIALDPEWIRSIQESLEELPEERKARLQDSFGLSDYDASVLVNDREMADFYEAVMKTAKEPKKAANWVIVEAAALLNKQNKSFADAMDQATNLADLVNAIEAGTISGKQAKEIFEEVMAGEAVADLIEKKGLKQLDNDDELMAIIEKVLDDNPQSIEDFKNGKKKATGYLMGQLMKATKGQANPKKANSLLTKALANR